MPLEIKTLGLATYTQTSCEKNSEDSFRVSVSKTSVWKIKKLEEELPIAKKKARNIVAVDETVVKARKKCCVYSAVDVERNELVMRVYTTKSLITKL